MQYKKLNISYDLQHFCIDEPDFPVYHCHTVYIPN